MNTSSKKIGLSFSLVLAVVSSLTAFAGIAKALELSQFGNGARTKSCISMGIDTICSIRMNGEISVYRYKN